MRARAVPLTRAVELLQGGIEQRQRDVLRVGDDPFFAALRGDARFAVRANAARNRPAGPVNGDRFSGVREARAYLVRRVNSINGSKVNV